MIIMAGTLCDSPHARFRPVRDGSGLRRDIVNHDNLCAFLERRDEIEQDSDATFIRPIVQYPSEEVDLRVLDRLRRQEIVRHECHPTGEVLRQVLLACFHDWRQILDDD